VKLEQFLGRTPTVEEIATAMQVEPRQIEWLLKVSWQPLSLEQPIGEDEDSEFGQPHRE
jgi:RNA polymerase primary sigma factor